MSSADVSSTSSARDDNEGENGTIPHPVGNGSVLRKACRAVYEELPRAGSTEGVAARGDREQRASSGIIGRHNRRRISRKQVPTALSRLNRETRAAKTVGIIVGCFIFCWAPFFTVYLLGAFCKDCTPKLVFSICFWLGYINSAINPLIYGLCSKQFRSAFYRLLICRRFRRRRSQKQVNMLIGEIHPNVHSSVPEQFDHLRHVNTPYQISSERPFVRPEQFDDLRHVKTPYIELHPNVRSSVQRGSIISVT